MTSVQDRPDVRQLRIQAKELKRAFASIEVLTDKEGSELESASAPRHYRDAHDHP